MTPFARVDRPNPSEIRPLVHALLSHLPAPEQTEKLAALFPKNFPTQKNANPSLFLVETSENYWLNGILIVRTATTQKPEFVLWVHPAPGATAILGQPQRIIVNQDRWELSCDVPQEKQCVLLKAAIDWAAELPIEMLQAVADPDDSAYHAVLQSVGLEKLVDLVFVSSPPLMPRAAEAEDSRKSPWYFQSLPPDLDNLERWYSVLSATYTNSQDCPIINGKRSAANTVAGYKATGSFVEQGWIMVRSSTETLAELVDNLQKDNSPGSMERDIGCLILADHPRNDFLELIYFGISQSARGKGLGRQILEEASQFAKKMGRNRIVAAVDRRNLPALRVYAALEYHAIEQKAIFARFYTTRPV